MALGIRRFTTGIALVGQNSTSLTIAGEMRYNSSSNRLEFYDTTTRQVVTDDGTQTLSNKTLTAPVIATIVNTGTLTLPTSTDTLVGRATTDTLTNKTISGSSNTLSNIADGSLSTSYIKADGTRALTGSWNAGAFQITANSVQVGSSANTISQLSTIVNTGTLTLPTSTDTLVGRATTDTLTNKTLTSPIINTPAIDIITFTEQSSTPSNPAASHAKLYFKTDDALYSLNSAGTETKISSGAGVTNSVAPRFTLSGETIPFTCIDGCYLVKTSNSIATVDMSMLNSGSSGSTTIQINQYRSGSLQASATASLSASSGNPTGSNVALSGTLSVQNGDVLTCDVNSIAGGTPSELSVQPVFT